MEDSTEVQVKIKKRKKSTRKHFDRRKNDQRIRQQRRKSKENPSACDDGSLAMADTSSLPRHWQKLDDGKFCKVEEGPNGLGQVTMSLLVEQDGSMSVLVAGRKVPSSSHVLTCWHSSNASEVLESIKIIDNAAVCPGNPDETFVLECKKREEEV